MAQRSSTTVLILANLVPVAGVLLFEWDVLSLLMLYWAENVIIGIINILRMICCQNDDLMKGLPQPTGGKAKIEYDEKLKQASASTFKWIVVPFFIVHYGAFCYGHLSFLLGFFSGGPRPLGAASRMLDLWQTSFWLAAGVIFCSHLYSFFTNYIRSGEYLRANLMMLMFRPYGRIIVMHLVVVFGAFLLALLQIPIVMLLLLIALKIGVDMRLHEKERSKLGAFMDSPA